MYLSSTLRKHTRAEVKIRAAIVNYVSAKFKLLSLRFPAPSTGHVFLLRILMVQEFSYLLSLRPASCDYAKPRFLFSVIRKSLKES